MNLRLRQFSLASLLFLAVAEAVRGVPAPPVKPIKDVLLLEQKLIGVWEGIACDGKMVFMSDGIYEWLWSRPGGSNSSGKMGDPLGRTAANPDPQLQEIRSRRGGRNVLRNERILKLDDSNSRARQAIHQDELSACKKD